MELPLLRRRFIIVALMLGLCITGTSFTVFQRSQHASAATAPYFSVNVGGQKYVAQYVGHAFSNQTSRSIYSNFGQWNEYTVDRSGKWHWYGQFSGNENVFYNAHGQVQGGLNVNVPGVGNINTYSHEKVLDPSLPRPSSQYNSVGPESYLGTRISSNRTAGGILEECEASVGDIVNRANVGVTRSIYYNANQANAVDGDCIQGNSHLERGDAQISSFYNQFQRLAATPKLNGPVLASLQHPQLPLPVILAVASGLFFIGSVGTGAICGFAACSKNVKLALAAVSVGMGVISGVLGLAGTILTALKAFATVAPAALAAVVEETAGVVEMSGSLSGSASSASTSFHSASSVLSTTLGGVHVAG